jgi:hypothetical protein
MKPFEEIGFELIGELKLSTGIIAYEMTLSDDKISPEEAIFDVRKRGLGWIQTDLIAVSGNFKKQFEMACKHFSEDQAKKPLTR